ncbi:MAG TPA: acetyl-CoA hydrolase/transferase C-terminal domain-containing protein [Acidimicrobiales bacterium]|nr:acetyl-CoA hydrolase/transferase C-terminal domain-containing protein [Acidimicrobiales bacterium]
MLLVEADALARHFSLPQAEPRIVASGNFAAPHVLLDVAETALPRFRLFMLNAQAPVPCREGVVHETPFVGPAARDSPALHYIPARLSLVPRLFDGPCPPDVVLLHTSTPRGGTLSLGTEVNIMPAAIAAARRRGALVVAQLNPRMPYTYGDAIVPLDAVDLAVEAEQILASPHRAAPDASTAAVAERVAAFIPDGATVQAGIGAIPDAVLCQLRSRRGLRVWTEMVSDGLLDLHEQGALETGAPITTSFCFGSPQLYEFLDGNEQVRMLRTETVNDPGTIARQRLMVSVNSALQVDLYAQANAHRVRGRVYSGFGGQTDFVVGALHAAGGQAIVALPSWHPRADVSTVVPVLDGPATSFQHSHIVTDVGAADIFGSGEAEQAWQIIEHAAHPSARPELRDAAARRSLVPREW